MKILVTGGAGFIGSHLCEVLANMGHQVVTIDSFDPHYDRSYKEKNIENFQQYGIELFEGDLTEKLPDALFCDVDMVYHAAAQPGISDRVPFEIYKKNNIEATHMLINNILTFSPNAFIVNIATSSIYGAHATGDELSVPAPTSYYGVTKLAAEQLVLAAQREGKVRGCSVRPFSVYGERERPEKFFRKCIDAMINNQSISMFEGSERHIRSFTYIEDIIAGLVAIIGHQDAVNGRIINLGTEESCTTGEAIKIIEAIFGKQAIIEHVSRRTGDQTETKAIITLAKSLIGFSPKVSLKEGLARQVAWQKSLKK